MKPKHKGPQDEPAVSASELAQMGRCERFVLFEHELGRRRTTQQQRDRARGLRAHEQFYREGLVTMTARRPEVSCSIADCVYGESWQTDTLRQFRDEVLQRQRVGRVLIRLYRLAAPWVCAVMNRWPTGRVLMRLGMDVIVAMLRRRRPQAGDPR